MFICSKCDTQHSKWSGRCNECGKWGTLTESADIKKTKKKSSVAARAQAVTDFSAIKTSGISRIETKISELDRVLGGGIVPGSIILLGGAPGIGKSTLVVQIAEALTKLSGPVLYVSGEESAEQIKMRLDRLKLDQSKLRYLGNTNVETIIATAKAEKPSLLIIDSIQTVSTAEAEPEAGSPTQVRASTTKFIEYAKAEGAPIILTGQITKEGSVAGPKALEHLVDTVLYLEGDPHHTYRLLRTAKNRFGNTDEVGVFEMLATGLEPVANPSARFLEQKSGVPGSVITCIIEGTRGFLVEVQALVNRTSFGYPVRRASGFDANRLQMLTAIIEKRAGLKLGESDIYVNVVGGFKLDEPAADLAVVAAIISASKNEIVDNKAVIFGEVGLGGEVRSVSYYEKRLSESERFGLEKATTPKQKGKSKNLTIRQIKSISEL